DLVNDDCGLVLGHHTSDDSLILGAIVPYGTRHASAGLAIEHALELAVQDDFAGGVPFGGGASEPTDGGAPRHPLAVVLCDETRDPKREALHLVNDVHVPVIFGPAFGESVLAVASVTTPAGVMLVSPYATADLGDASSDLVWRTSPTSDGEAAAMADVITQVVAPRVASARGHAAQIAIAWSTDPDGAALHARLAPLVASDAAPTIDASCGDPDVAGADR